MELHGEPIPLHLPRHAVSPRQVARAGEVWRLCQVAAVEAAVRRGWPPGRMLATNGAFIVAHMTVRHLREASYGEAVHARTWLRDFRRATLTRREIRILGERGPIARATQQWVWVDAELRPTRAPEEMVADFVVHGTIEAPVGLPPYEVVETAGRVHELAFEVWQTWMDPIGHVNHPAYVDWCDEAAARVLARAGLSGQDLVPVAEHVRFRRGAVAGEPVCVRTSLAGRTDQGDVVLRHRITDGGDGLYAEALAVRRHADGVELSEVFA